MFNPRQELYDRLVLALFALSLQGRTLTAGKVLRRWERWRRGEPVKITWNKL